MKKPTEKKPVGRPKSDKKKYLISVLPKHIDAIRAFIKSLHEPKDG